MSGKTLLANLLATCGMTAAATAVAASVASGAPDVSAADQTAGTESLEKLVEAAHAEGQKEGRKAERERLGAVLTSEDALGKTGLAITLLSTTELTAEQIAGALKASPSAAAAAPAPAATQPPAGQRAAADPLATGGDAIADDTALVDPGAAQPPVDGMDEKQVASLWKGALAGKGGGVTEGSVWDFGAFGGDQAQRAN